MFNLTLVSALRTQINSPCQQQSWKGPLYSTRCQLGMQEMSPPSFVEDTVGNRLHPLNVHWREVSLLRTSVLCFVSDWKEHTKN